MPSLNISVGPLGPLVQVTVGISIPKQAALKAAGLALPAMAQGQGRGCARSKTIW